VQCDHVAVVTQLMALSQLPFARPNHTYES
jgi:hypothetical protein